jgi:hypothetical protein
LLTYDVRSLASALVAIFCPAIRGPRVTDGPDRQGDSSSGQEEPSATQDQAEERRGVH